MAKRETTKAKFILNGALVTLKSNLLLSHNTKLTTDYETTLTLTVLLFLKHTRNKRHNNTNLYTRNLYKQTFKRVEPLVN